MRGRFPKTTQRCESVQSGPRLVPSCAVDSLKVAVYGMCLRALIRKFWDGLCRI